MAMEETLMSTETEGLMNAKEAARYLRVSEFTLSRIEREGGLVPYRTPGGHRRYDLFMLNRYLELSRLPEGRKKQLGFKLQRGLIVGFFIGPDEGDLEAAWKLIETGLAVQEGNNLLPALHGKTQHDG